VRGFVSAIARARGGDENRSHSDDGTPPERPSRLGGHYSRREGLASRVERLPRGAPIDFPTVPTAVRVAVARRASSRGRSTGPPRVDFDNFWLTLFHQQGDQRRRISDRATGIRGDSGSDSRHIYPATRRRRCDWLRDLPGSCRRSRDHDVRR